MLNIVTMYCYNYLKYLTLNVHVELQGTRLTFVTDCITSLNNAKNYNNYCDYYLKQSRHMSIHGELQVKRVTFVIDCIT